MQCVRPASTFTVADSHAMAEWASSWAAVSATILEEDALERLLSSNSRKQTNV